MTPRKSCPTVPKPLEEYAQHFDDVFGQLAQRRSFREYLLGLLLPRDRNGCDFAVMYSSKPHSA